MKTKNVLLLLFITAIHFNPLFAQIHTGIYELKTDDSLLTKEVKEVLNTHLDDKKVVFLGESQHHSGSDFLAKTEFVKYLVLEKGYKDIAFEGDFFGLFFDHNKSNLYSFWSQSKQCESLFEFIEEHDVTIWGFDNQMGSGYSWHNFSETLSEFLTENSIAFDPNFIEQTELFIKNRRKAKTVVGKSQLEGMLKEIDKLLKNKIVKTHRVWVQILSSYKSDILINSTHKSKAKGIPIRDKQMAENLDFLIKSMTNKKFIIWLANAHMAKHNYDFMKGQTMGSKFVKLNPGISYHIAFSSIYMPYRKEKWIKKMSQDEDDLLYLLPSIKKNWFIDSNQIINDHPDYSDKEFEGMFNLNRSKTNWFKHFDALVFISKGEKMKYKNELD